MLNGLKLQLIGGKINTSNDQQYSNNIEGNVTSFVQTVILCYINIINH
jgi:hypothetical protein